MGAATRGHAALSSIASIGRALTRVPAPAWVCAALAFANAASWSLITPPFQAPDESDHFAYVQHLAETGHRPTLSKRRYSREETVALQDLAHARVRFRPSGKPIFSLAEQEKLQRDLALPLERSGPGGAGVAVSEPPLYYAFETIPYGLRSNGSILDRLELMRLLSAFMGGLTALFAFLFLREALPAARWTWTVGGLGVAMAPLLGFMSGAVNPDALLFAICAAIFYWLARAFRRCLTRRSALALGGLICAGCATKLSFVGVVPGVLLGLVLLARRASRVYGSEVYLRALAPALALAASPAILYVLINALSGRAALGIVSSGLGTLTSRHRSLAGALSYIWQFYLPRLPGMRSDFGQIFTTRQIWFRDMVGMYGWSDTVFPRWVYNLALIPAGAIAALCLRALMVGRYALRRRAGELVTYGSITVGVLVLVGAAGYHEFPALSAEYAEPRYMLPLVALWGGALALAVRGLGRRWGSVAGTMIVAIVIAHDVFSQLQTIARYYG